MPDAMRLRILIVEDAESEALRERAKKARGERPPTEGPP